MMMTCKTLYRTLGGVLAVLTLYGSAGALDLQAYDPARNDAIRNGLYLVFGPEAGKYASVELPAEHRAVANVYDFRARPVNAAFRRTGGGRTGDEFLVDCGTDAQADAGDTVYYRFTVVDTSRLDSAAVQAGTVCFNRMCLEATAGAAGARGTVFNDRNRNGRMDADDDAIIPGASFSMVPGETLHVGLAVTVPLSGLNAVADTVTLVCRTDLARPDNRQLRTTFRSVVRSVVPVFAGPARPAVSGPLAMVTDRDGWNPGNGNF